MLFIAAALALLSSPMFAKGWEVMFPQATGSSRSVQVGPNDGETPLAHVDNGKGKRLFLECRTTKAGVPEWTLRFDPGPEPSALPIKSKGIPFVLAFDDEAPDPPNGALHPCSGGFRGGCAGRHRL